MISYKKVLILGSNSFSGNNFVNFSLSKGKKVIGISRSNEVKKPMSSYFTNKNKKNFKFYKLDINKNLDKFIKITKSFKPEVIINYSAQGDVRHSWKDPKQWYETNCMGVVNYTSELLNCKFIKKYISISTPEVYGSNPKEIIENNNFNPSTPYAASKLAGDLHLMTLFKKYNFPVLFTRSSNVYGPHQQLYRIIPKTIIKIKLNQVIHLHGRGKGKRDFIDISDVNEAINLLIKKGKNGDSYNVANKGNLISILELVNKICSIMKVNNTKKIINFVDENFCQDNI